MANEHPSHVTVSFGGAGFFAVLVTWNDDGFYEPWNTGFGRYLTGDDANEEAKMWADAESLEYRPAYVGSDYATEMKKSEERSQKTKLRIAMIKDLKEKGMSYLDAQIAAADRYPY